jgi:hypothetical protein
MQKRNSNICGVMRRLCGALPITQNILIHNTNHTISGEFIPITYVPVPDSHPTSTGMWYIIHSMTDTPQIITIPATELNLRAGNVLCRVLVDRQHIIIERNGYPIAVMIPIHDYHQDMAYSTEGEK